MPDMTVKEAGRLGGNTLKEKYGLPFFSAIGKKGRAAQRKATDPIT